MYEAERENAISSLLLKLVFPISKNAGSHDSCKVVVHCQPN